MVERIDVVGLMQGGWIGLMYGWMFGWIDGWIDGLMD